MIDVKGMVFRMSVTKETAVPISDHLIAGWRLDDGGTAQSVAPEIPEGTPGTLRWGVWLPNRTFGMTLDFSTQGSQVRISGGPVLSGNQFAVSAWVLAPPREQLDRTLIRQGISPDEGFRLYLDACHGHALTFSAPGLDGTGNSGVSLTDGRWHHVLVSCSGDCLTYYIDRQAVKALPVTGTLRGLSRNIFLGSDEQGGTGLDGSLAQVRLYNAPKFPGETTQTVLDTRDNTPSPVLPLKKGIVIDRRQYIQPVPLPSEGQTVLERDIVNCRNMGFDHVKLLLTPNHLIRQDGSLIRENMAYITHLVDAVERHRYRCILCIHPEDDFKPFYLGNLDNFEILLKWYGQLAAYIGEHWGPETLALQLMTEPAKNTPEVSWSWMSDRMWGAARNVLPYHTLITSSDDWGHIERIKDMSPATDPNLIYSFTTYEPYTIGWYYYSFRKDQMDGWGYVKDIPYPLEDGVDYTQAVENAIEWVPEAFRQDMREQLTAYVQGRYDGKRRDRPNLYPCLYGPQWHRARAKSLDEWRQKYGGNISIMCVEFGCMDAQTPREHWHTAIPGAGISSEARLRFTRDMRISFDEYDIGWCYWSYNEAHTIFKMPHRTPGESPLTENLYTLLDMDMLEKGLNVSPVNIQITE